MSHRNPVSDDRFMLSLAFWILNSAEYILENSANSLLQPCLVGVLKASLELLVQLSLESTLENTILS